MNIKNLSVFDNKWLNCQCIPVIRNYYDRADMIKTTKQFSHSHAMAEIMYVNSGMLSLKVNNEMVKVGRKQYIWIDAGVNHSDFLFESFSVSMMNIEYMYVQDNVMVPSLKQIYNSFEPMEYMLKNPMPYRVFTDHDNTMYLLLKQIISLAENQNKETQNLISLLCTQVTMILANQWKLKQLKHIPILNNYVSFTNEYLKNNYQEDILIKDIAEKKGIHPSYLHKLYKQYTGKTLINKLHEIRMEKASELLKNTNNSIVDISNSVGIESQAYFQKLFKRYYNLTPNQYRKQNKT